MLNGFADAGAGLQVLAGRTDAQPSRWSGALTDFFETGRRVLRRVQTDIRVGRLRSRSFLFGQAGDHGLSEVLDALMNSINTEYAIDLIAPFEDTASIAGALWSGANLFGGHRSDGLAKLRFAEGTLDLPLHVHEHSDRFIAVLNGAGRFWWSEEPLAGFTARDIQSVAAKAGDVLVFTRNLLHTFSAPEEDLVLLSYHSPEIPFDDPRQYTLPNLRWTPRIGLAQ